MTQSFSFRHAELLLISKRAQSLYLPRDELLTFHTAHSRLGDYKCETVGSQGETGDRKSMATLITRSLEGALAPNSISTKALDPNCIQFFRA